MRVPIRARRRKRKTAPTMMVAVFQGLVAGLGVALGVALGVGELVGRGAMGVVVE